MRIAGVLRAFRPVLSSTMAADSDHRSPARFVLDCSVALSWCFPDEKTHESDQVLQSLKRGTAIVPSLWFLEVSNALLVGQRRRRVTADVARQALTLLGQLPIETDDRSGFSLSSELLTIASQHTLSTYDAAYLELALRLSLPLATLDRQLKTAAEAAGVAHHQG
jgi:predicted nucleic acid-binding protein